jgi:putative endonuclease
MQMSNHKQVYGQWGEEMAVKFLTDNGYSVLTRNLRSAHGEIDIIVHKDGLLVFVEVKTRRSHTYGYPEDAVTTRKQAFMLSAAEEYLLAHPDGNESWQFDVIAIVGTPGGKVQIEHFENVIS